MSTHENVNVTHIPDCDMCTDEGISITPAFADALLPKWGSWAYVCIRHYLLYGCTLGLGYGQELILIGDTPTEGETE